MQAMLVIGHPTAGSFSHALALQTEQALASRGYRCAVQDLYAEGFNPVQPVGESSNTTSSDALVEAHCRELQRADVIAVFHPNWWSQPPAMVKGWIDRVFRLGTAYDYADGVGYDGVPRGLLKARAAFVFNTSNTPPDRERTVFGDPLESLWRTSIFGLCGVRHVHRRMFGPMAGSTEVQRRAWLAEASQLVEREF